MFCNYLFYQLQEEVTLSKDVEIYTLYLKAKSMNWVILNHFLSKSVKFGYLNLRYLLKYSFFQVLDGVHGTSAFLFALDVLEFIGIWEFIFQK